MKGIKPKEDVVAADSVRMIAAFMLDCNAVGVHAAGENLVRSIKERVAAYRASGFSDD